jgi:hypothetical protein
MKRQVIRAFVLLGLLAALVNSSALAQNVPDKVTVRDRKDNSTKAYEGTFTVGPTGFQVISTGADKKVLATVAPDDVVKVAIGDLPGVARDTILVLNGKEEKKEWDGVRTGYIDLLKKAGLPERSKRYLEFKTVSLTQKIVDELDPGDKGWKDKADACIADWNQFLISDDTKLGWEQWPGTRACTRLQIERGKYDDAARAWNRVAKNPNMPPDAKLEAAIQEIDMQIRSRAAAAYSAAATTAGELAKTAAGTKKDRLVIYELAAKAGSTGKPLDGIEPIKAEMNKTKDPGVHATGFSMMGELYLAGNKPRDAMWMFLWVETVVNQDRDEVFKALSRLSEMFETQMDEEQSKKYHDKIKRFRATF